MRTIDRYVIRELIPPFVIALVVFTFILIIPFIIELAEQMIAKGVPWTTLLRLALTLLPGQLALTIPMAFLVALLVAFGRLSADREVVVLMACGVSPYRLLRPVIVFAVAAWAATSWMLLKAMPDANQAFREISLRIVMDRAEGEVRPRVFFEDFPGYVLYVREVPTDGGWRDVVAADTSNPTQPIIYLARQGRMDVNRTAKTIQMVLEDGTRHQTKVDDPAAYEVLRFDRTVVSLDPERVFPKQGPARGDRELTIAELQARAAELSAQGLSPHNQIIEMHTKFSIPVACFVFGVLGLALGASHRRDGRLASFVIGIAIIFVYYVIMFTARAMTKGHLIPAWSAMWWPNLILGAAGVWLLLSRARSADQPLRFPPLGWLVGRPTASDSSRPDNTSDAQSAARTIALSARRKLPSVTALRPNLLDMYVAKRYLQVLAMTIVGMLGLFYISTFIDLSDKWFKGQTTLAMLLELLWWSTPQFVSYIIALAVLLSALVTIGLLTKNSELIVMRACGISLYRTAMPLVMFGAVASALLWQMEESVLAPSNQRAGRLNHVIRGGSPQTFDVLNRKWVLGHNGEVYHYQFYDPRRHELNGLSVFQFDPQGHTITRRIYATKATWEAASADGVPHWRLEQGWSRKFGSTAEITAFDRFESSTVVLEPPDYFVTEAPEPQRMTFGQLKIYIDELRASGYSVLDHEVGLYRKVAFPFVTLVMTLIAVPFAVTTGRRGAMYGVGVGIALALVYWTMISVFAAFGAAGLISPLLAAWAPNLLFGATAAVLVLTVRT